MNATIHNMLDELQRIGRPWPEGASVRAMADPCRDGWWVSLAWGQRGVGTFVGAEDLWRERTSHGAVFVRKVHGLTKAMAREVGGCGLGPVAAAALEGLVPT